MATPARIEPRLLKPLTSLRLFAALMILVHHLCGEWGLPSQIGQLELSQGVSFFFVLSGFILTFVYRDKLKMGGARRFFKARTARLYPLHWTTLIAVLLMFNYAYFPDRLDWFVANALLLQAWYPSVEGGLTFNSVSWSISCEIFFYACFPFLMKTYRRIGLVFLIYIFAFFITTTFLHTFFTSQEINFILYVNPAIRIVEFIFGMVLAKFYLSHMTAGFSDKTWSILEVGVLLLVIAAMVFTGFLSEGFSLLFPAAAHWFAGSGLFPLYGALILVFAYERGVLSRLLSHPWLVLGGEISFSIYMTHQIILRFYRERDVVTVGLTNLTVIGLILMTTFVVSFLSWRFIEMPFRSKVTRPGHTLRGEWTNGLTESDCKLAVMALATVALVAGYGAWRGYRPAAPSAVRLVVESPTSIRETSFPGSGLILVGIAPAQACGPDLCATLIWRVADPVAAAGQERIINFFGSNRNYLGTDRRMLVNKLAKAGKGDLIADRMRTGSRLANIKGRLYSVGITVRMAPEGPNHPPQVTYEKRYGPFLLIGDAFEDYLSVTPPAS